MDTHYWKRKCFVSFVLGSTLVGTLAANESFAFSQTTSSIFDKRNRVLSPPPKSLRSDSEQIDYRLATEAERLESGPEANPATRQPVNEQKKKRGDAQQSSYRPRTGSWREPSTKVSEYSFSGKRVFGVGLVGAGAYGVFGAEVDFTLNRDWSFGMGLGTGMNYSSWGMHSRYFLQQGSLNTFFQFGYANWFLGRTSSRNEDILPNYLANRFFKSENGVFDESQGAHLVYPGMGVLFQYESGLATTLMVQYLINARDFSGALFGSAGFFYYF